MFCVWGSADLTEFASANLVLPYCLVAMIDIDAWLIGHGVKCGEWIDSVQFPLAIKK